ncbi:MAG TPA: hypothetical protein VME01_00265 [Solirubrobacteraceae bacterium]|nr:hypothetical protein [Solirubrobacteraceae bacterium]
MVALLFAVLVAGCGAGAPRPASVARAHNRAAAVSPRVVNRPAAERDVRHMIAALSMPAGARQVSREPDGDHGYLRASSSPLVIDNRGAQVREHRWWIVSEPSSQVLAYLDAHVPRGASKQFSGSGGNVYKNTWYSTVGYQWPQIAGVVDLSDLTVTLTALPDGSTGILAVAESDWVLLRSASERVPAGVTRVVVTLARTTSNPSGKRGFLRSASITKPALVARAVKLVDSLPISQGATMSCTLEAFPARLLTVTYSAGPAGPALAKAELILWKGGGANGCDPIRFWIRGRPQTALLSASFAAQMEKLSGLSTDS